jgi:hypothetical protein
MRVAMSAIGTKRTSLRAQPMSAFRGNADIAAYARSRQINRFPPGASAPREAHIYLGPAGAPPSADIE